MTLTVIERSLSVAISTSLAVSGAIHAVLYVDGYRAVPMIGGAFLLQASVSWTLAVLILLGGPGWLKLAAAALALGALAAFGLTRTVGVFGFVEIGWDPPYGVVSVIAEVVTLVSCAAGWVGDRRLPTVLQ